MSSQVKRTPILKAEDDHYYMTEKNLQICNKNQDRYSTPELNDAFQLHYYGFCNIDNLQPYSNINTLYLNNNVISKIENLSFLKKLVTLNLANNRISKIEGLEELVELFILDLSGNKIEKVENIQNLQKLATFNISGNLLCKSNSIAPLIKNSSLTCLNLSNNPLPEDLELFDYIQQIPLLTLFLKDTKFSRGVPSYRKETICRVKKLTFLDERPVTSDERMMAEAWKSGGLQAEKQARKHIQQSKEQKSKKIYNEMMQRSEKIQKLRDQLFKKLTVHEHEQLQSVKARLADELKKQELNQFEINLLKVKIEQLETYLKYYRLDVNEMDVSEKKDIPNNLCERHEKDAIYIYGVTEQQLPRIKQVYYPDDPRPLIAKDFEKKVESRWVENYDDILNKVCVEHFNKSQFILPVFNLRVHEFDAEYDRKARRFMEAQVKQKIDKVQRTEAQHEIEIEHEAENKLNLLD